MHRFKRRPRLTEPRWFEKRVREIVRDERLHRYVVWGDEGRLFVDETAVVNDALFNTVSGTISIQAHAGLGHGVSLLTGTHDITQRGPARATAVPESGRDIVVGTGAWVASKATVLGPAVIGEDAVVAAGAVVTGDVPARAIYAGVPARRVGAV